jgi:hypothetical protein
MATSIPIAPDEPTHTEPLGMLPTSTATFTERENIDDDVALFMLAKAERLANEIKYTCSSSAGSSRRCAESPKVRRTTNSSLPETIETKDAVTECSSIAFMSMAATETPVQRTVVDGKSEREVKKEHRFLSSPEASQSEQSKASAVESIVALPAKQGEMRNPINQADQSPPTPNAATRIVNEKSLCDNIELASELVAAKAPSERQPRYIGTRGVMVDGVSEEQKSDRAVLDIPALMHDSNCNHQELSSYISEADTSDPVAHKLQLQLCSTLDSTASNSWIWSPWASADASKRSETLWEAGSMNDDRDSCVIIDEEKMESPQSSQALSSQVTPLSSNKTISSEAAHLNNDSVRVVEYKSTIKWEKVTSARKGDDDYVPLSDYSSPSRLRSHMTTDPYLKNTTYAGRRAALQRKRRTRRHRMIALVSTVTLTIGIALSDKLYGLLQVYQPNPNDLIIIEGNLQEQFDCRTDVEPNETDLESLVTEIDVETTEPSSRALAVMKRDGRFPPKSVVSLRPIADILEGIRIVRDLNRQDRKRFVEELLDSMMQ